MFFLEAPDSLALIELVFSLVGFSHTRAVDKDPHSMYYLPHIAFFVPCLSLSLLLCRNGIWWDRLLGSRNLVLRRHKMLNSERNGKFPISDQQSKCTFSALPSPVSAQYYEMEKGSRVT
jgi:hypothetical protein